jgi:hypothetical protein
MSPPPQRRKLLPSRPRIRRLIEPLVIQRQDLICADHKRSRMPACNGLRLGDRQRHGTLDGIGPGPPLRRFYRAFVEVGRVDRERDPGLAQ